MLTCVILLRHMQPRTLHCSGKNRGCQKQYWAEVSGSFLIHCCFLGVHPFFSQEDVFHRLRKGSVFPTPGFISESLFFLAIMKALQKYFFWFEFMVLQLLHLCMGTRGWLLQHCGRCNRNSLFQKPGQNLVSWLPFSEHLLQCKYAKGC